MAVQETEKIEYTGINRLLKVKSLQILIDKWEDGSIWEFLNDWRWIFSFSKKYRWIIVFYTILGIVGTVLSLGSAWVSKILINIIVGREVERLWLLLGLMIGTNIFSLISRCILNRVGKKISIYVHNDIQATIFTQIIDAEWTELNRFPNGDLLNRFKTDTSTVSSNAINWIPNLIISIFSFLATFLLLFKTDPIMAWFALGSAPFLLLISRVVLRKMRIYKQRVLEMNSDMMTFEVETFYNFDMIKSFGVTGQSIKKLKDWQNKYKDCNLDYNKLEIQSNAALSMISIVVSMLAFGYCLWRLWSGQILYGDMTFFLSQRSRLTTQFNNLVETVPGMVGAAISAHRIRELCEIPKEKHDPESYEKIAQYAEHGLTVEMKDVSFAYTEDKPVYEHGNFLARPGEIVAILGPSGEGKTTMLRLLLDLIHPSEGSVTIMDSTGTCLPMNADLRRLISYVPQGNSMMAGTIADNLRLVKENASDDELIDALKLACAWDFIQLKPDGINSKVGEKGSGLSEGQAQRIAIARAVLRDAPILLLDEATSALDMETEKRVLDNLILNCPKKTCIVSTHRKSILQHCKRVYHIQERHAVLVNEDHQIREHRAIDHIAQSPTADDE